MEISNNRSGFFLGSLVTFSLLALLVYSVLGWLGIEPGSLINWFFGVVVFWWFVVIVVLPWDFYFQAKTLLKESTRNQEKGLKVNEADITYVKLWAKWSFVLAIGLHLLTALALILLQLFGFTSLGYFAAIAAVLLMGFRPLGKWYDYLISRLSSIGREVKYPKDNVEALLLKVSELESQVANLTSLLDLDESESWASQNQKALQNLAGEQEMLRTQVEDLRRTNEEAHRQLARDAESAAAQIAEDGRVLNHVRELVRFFKDA